MAQSATVQVQVEEDCSIALPFLELTLQQQVRIFLLPYETRILQPMPTFLELRPRVSPMFEFQLWQLSKHVPVQLPV